MRWIGRSPMASERQIVCVARTSFASPTADGRFPHGVVRKGQLLLETDPIVQGTPEHLWTSVGTADVVTAQLITDLGPMATLRDLLPRLRPIDGGEALHPPADTGPVLGRRGRGRPGWTADLFRRRWREAIERGKVPEPATIPAVAPTFVMLDGEEGIDPEYLGRLARRFGVE
jgi:hypothetical protein